MATTEYARGQNLGEADTFISGCSKCGIRWKVPRMFYQVKLSDHSVFYCPNGHKQYFITGKTNTEIQRERAEQAERKLVSERARHDQTRADRDFKENQRRAEKGAKTRLKNRAAAGVCPCCNRTFKQLAAHMQTKHPDWNKSTT